MPVPTVEETASAGKTALRLIAATEEFLRVKVDEGSAL
jgi:hypothetical protein